MSVKEMVTVVVDGGTSGVGDVLFLQKFCCMAMRCFQNLVLNNTAEVIIEGDQFLNRSFVRQWLIIKYSIETFFVSIALFFA